MLGNNNEIKVDNLKNEGIYFNNWRVLRCLSILGREKKEGILV